MDNLPTLIAVNDSSNISLLNKFMKLFQLQSPQCKRLKVDEVEHSICGHIKPYIGLLYESGAKPPTMKIKKMLDNNQIVDV